MRLQRFDHADMRKSARPPPPNASAIFGGAGRTSGLGGSSVTGAGLGTGSGPRGNTLQPARTLKSKTAAKRNELTFINGICEGAIVSSVTGSCGEPLAKSDLSQASAIAPMAEQH